MWLVPLGVGAASLFATDLKASENVRAAGGLRPASRLISEIGSAPPLAGAATFLAAGKLADNEKRRQPAAKLR
jgi:hypothetical protein